jgi:hypothetical protein
MLPLASFAEVERTGLTVTSVNWTDVPLSTQNNASGGNNEENPHPV